MTEVRANGVDIAYQSLGRDSDPAILLIHGLATPLTGWPDSLCGGLTARGFRVVRFDNRDVGRSTYFRQFGAPDIGAMISTLRSAGRSRPIRSTTWPPTQQPCSTRWELSGRTLSARRWAA